MSCLLDVLFAAINSRRADIVLHCLMTQVRQRLEDRLGELEPLPELLKSTELRLHDAHEKLLAYDRKYDDKTQVIADLTAKVQS